MILESLAVRSVLVVLIGLIAAGFLRNRAASIRHTVYAATVLSLLLLPVMRQVGRSIYVKTDTLPPVMRVVTDGIPTTSQINSVIPATQGSSTASNVVHLGAVGLAVVWVGGVLVLCGRLFVQMLFLARLTRRSEAVSVPGFDGTPIRMSDRIQVPIAAWAGRSLIIVPTAYSEWPECRLRSVLLHESAHVERSDWLVQLLVSIACALYWPNPLVWLLRRRVLDLAEQAADDHVLQAGVRPSNYAEDLLQIARTVRQGRPALTIPMVAKSDVGRRIEMVLNNKKQRGRVHVGGLVLAGIGTAAISLPAANLLLQQRVADRTSPYADIRNGKTVPGAEGNGFVAALADGRTVELFQILWHKPDGTLEAWKPDGSSIAMKDAFPAQYHGSEKGMMEFLYRGKFGPTTSTAGMGSGPSVPGEPPTQTFAGNWVLKRDNLGETVVVSLMNIPEPGPSGMSSYSFDLCDGPPRVSATYDLSSGSSSNDGTYASDVKVNPNAVARLFRYDKNGEAIKDASGKYLRNEVPAIEISFNYPGNPMTLEPETVGVTESGKLVEPIFGAGENYRSKESFAKDAGIERIEIRTRPLHAVEFTGVHIRPNGSGTP